MERLNTAWMSQECINIISVVSGGIYGAGLAAAQVSNFGRNAYGVAIASGLLSGAAAGFIVCHTCVPTVMFDTLQTRLSIAATTSFAGMTTGIIVGQLLRYTFSGFLPEFTTEISHAAAEYCVSPCLLGSVEAEDLARYLGGVLNPDLNWMRFNVTPAETCRLHRSQQLSATYKKAYVGNGASVALWQESSVLATAMRLRLLDTDKGPIGTTTNLGHFERGVNDWALTSLNDTSLLVSLSFRGHILIEYLPANRSDAYLINIRTDGHASALSLTPQRVAHGHRFLLGYKDAGALYVKSIELNSSGFYESSSTYNAPSTYEIVSFANNSVALVWTNDTGIYFDSFVTQETTLLHATSDIKGFRVTEDLVVRAQELGRYSEISWFITMYHPMIFEGGLVALAHAVLDRAKNDPTHPRVRATLDWLSGFQSDDGAEEDALGTRRLYASKSSDVYKLIGKRSRDLALARGCRDELSVSRAILLSVREQQLLLFNSDLYLTNVPSDASVDHFFAISPNQILLSCVLAGQRIDRLVTIQNDRMVDVVEATQPCQDVRYSGIQCLVLDRPANSGDEWLIGYAAYISAYLERVGDLAIIWDGNIRLSTWLEWHSCSKLTMLSKQNVILSMTGYVKTSGSLELNPGVFAGPPANVLFENWNAPQLDTMGSVGKLTINLYELNH